MTMDLLFPLASDEDIHGWAEISADEQYRYELGRRWAAGPLLGWVMLNPSRADKRFNDQTVLKVIAPPASRRAPRDPAISCAAPAATPTRLSSPPPSSGRTPSSA